VAARMSGRAELGRCRVQLHPHDSLMHGKDGLMRLNARVCVCACCEFVCASLLFTGCNFERRESSIFQRIMCVGDGILSLLAPLMSHFGEGAASCWLLPAFCCIYAANQADLI
jgi:hypothetical protein